MNSTPRISQTATVDRALINEVVSAEVHSLLEAKRITIAYNEVFVSGAFQTIFAHMLLELEDSINKQFAESNGRQKLANPSAQIRDFSHLAMQYFQAQLTAKLQTTMVELLGEALWYAGKALPQRDSADDEVIKDTTPSEAMLQQTVLRPTVERFKQHPLLERANEEEYPNQPTDPLARIGQKVFDGQVMYAYDVEGVRELFQEFFRPLLSQHKNLSPANLDYLVDQHAREAGEFIWENIDGAIQSILQILSGYAGALAQQAVAKRRNIDIKKARLKLPRAASLKEFAIKEFDLWFDNLPVAFKSAGGGTPEIVPSDEDCLKYVGAVKKFSEVVIAAKKRYRELRNTPDAEAIIKKEFPLFKRLPDVLIQEMASTKKGVAEPARLARKFASYEFDFYGQTDSWLFSVPFKRGQKL